MTFVLVVLAHILVLTSCFSSFKHFPKSPFRNYEVPEELPFWGVTEVYQFGKQAYSKTYGYTSYTHQVEMPLDAKFPIGSNTKLFAAVAIYQLQEKGLLNVTDDISLYLDESDFKAFGYPNVTKYCPVLYNDSSNTCEKITFVDLMSMSSGIVEVIDCDYDNDSPFLKYCWDFCSIMYLYNGSIADYVSTFIMAPLTFPPKEKFDYSSANFMLISYFIEKLSGMYLGDYFKKYIFDVIGLNNTIYDQWTGYFGKELKVVDGWTIILNLQNRSEELGIGWLEPIWSYGVMNGAGGILSTTTDMSLWYQELFNPHTIPKVFNDVSSRNALIQPLSKVGLLPGNYYGQGVFIEYDMNINNTWPLTINYIGGTLCCDTAIKMKPDYKQTIVTAFSNAPRMYIPNGKEGLNNIKYNINENNCQMLLDNTYLLDGAGAGVKSSQLFVKFIIE